MSSLLLGTLLAGAHLTALMVLPFLAMPSVLKLAVAGMILLSLYEAIRRHVLLRHRGAVKHLTWHSFDRITILDDEGHESPAVVHPQSFTHRWAMILILTLSDGSTRVLILLPDSAPAETLWQLRARLRLAAVDQST